MFKIIILPNKFFFPFGKIYKVYDLFLSSSLCDFFINNSIYIKNYCGGFGKCSSCSVFINESSYSNLKGFKQSCNLFCLDNHIIVSI
ncbi:MAG: hypothetical protein ACSHUF_00270 [Candidatus Nasuia deltocephalinicola]